MNKETRLISLDTSTKCSGVATFDNCKLVDYQLFDFHKEKDVEKRIDMMGKELLSYLKKQKPDIIWIEHPQGQGSNVSMVGKLCEVLGIVRAYAIEKKVDYHEIMPSEWRKYAKFDQGKKERGELQPNVPRSCHRHAGRRHHRVLHSLHRFTRCGGTPGQPSPLCHVAVCCGRHLALHANHLRRQKKQQPYKSAAARSFHPSMRSRMDNGIRHHPLLLIRCKVRSLSYKQRKTVLSI